MSKMIAVMAILIVGSAQAGDEPKQPAPAAKASGKSLNAFAREPWRLPPGASRRLNGTYPLETAAWDFLTIRAAHMYGHKLHNH
ncbi:MAG: hypothetical protein HC834_08275 [Rhodospirillales bacterium]|nr:hypothetical protein [Rhodospirillales bacterium]